MDFTLGIAAQMKDFGWGNTEVLVYWVNSLNAKKHCWDIQGKQFSVNQMNTIFRYLIHYVHDFNAGRLK